MARLGIDLNRIEEDEKERIARLFPDFSGVKKLLLENLNSVCPLAGVGARDRGNERITLNPSREDKHVGSFSLNRESGAYRDLATGDKGSILDLYAKTLGVSCIDASRKAIEAFGLPSDWKSWKEPFLLHDATESGSRALPPVPFLATQRCPARVVSKPKWAPAPVDAAPEFRTAEGYTRKPSYVFRYQKDEGSLAFVIGRFDRTNGEKAFSFCYWTEAKQWVLGEPEEFKGKRPLFNLLAVQANGNVPVVIVEGEKKVLSGMSVPFPATWVSWAGGASSVQKTDWSPLEGRTVVLWPDHDEPGLEAMRSVWRLLKPLGCTMFLVQVPEDKSSGWDVWDSLQEDPTGREAIDLLSSVTEVER